MGISPKYLIPVFAVLLASPFVYIHFTSRGTGFLVLQDGMFLNESYCGSKGIKDQVTVFHSPECPVCLGLMPVLGEVRDETGYKFEFINTKGDTSRMMQLGMAPAYVPTVVINCRVYVGFKTKQQLIGLIRSAPP